MKIGTKTRVVTTGLRELWCGTDRVSGLGELSGSRNLFVIGLVLFTASSVSCEVAPTVSLLIAARVAQGSALRS